MRRQTQWITQLPIKYCNCSRPRLPRAPWRNRGQRWRWNSALGRTHVAISPSVKRALFRDTRRADGSPKRCQVATTTQLPSHAPRAELKAVRNEDKAHPPPNHPRMPPCGAEGSPERCHVSTTTPTTLACTPTEGTADRNEGKRHPPTPP